MRDRTFPLARCDATIPAVTEAAFTHAVTRHRRELHCHCARIVGAGDADDAVQETFLRAWRARGTNRGVLRAWLYRIATNVCRDLLARRDAHMPLDDETGVRGGDEPDAMVIAKETVELAMLTALRRLPARQHASLLLRDVLRCSAGETAMAMSSTVAATNSAVQRGREGLRTHLGQPRLDWRSARPTTRERRLVDSLVAACG
jgi:RNA polymerase sigma-70 factor (ECF subfamily)